MALYTLNVKSGELNVIYRSTDWLNHVQMSPTDPTLIMYCHEGPWHKVDRIWTIRTDGSNRRLMHERTMDMEIAGHEFFGPDGKTIWYDLQTPKSKVFWLAGVDVATGKTTRYSVDREHWSVHFNVSPDGTLFAGDGGGPRSVAAPGQRPVDLPVHAGGRQARGGAPRGSVQARLPAGAERHLHPRRQVDRLPLEHARRRRTCMRWRSPGRNSGLDSRQAVHVNVSNPRRRHPSLRHTNPDSSLTVAATGLYRADGMFVCTPNRGPGGPMRGLVRLHTYGAAVLGCVLLTALPAAAQFDRAQVSGTVRDAQGGVVPGASVSATNTQTQVVSTTVSDSGGFFTIPNLASGRYDVSAELQGFKKALRQSVPLDAGASLRLDFALETGTITEAVTVTAEATPLQTDVTVRKTVEAKDIELLSFSGRNPIGVPALKAGVIGGSFNNAGFSSLTTGGFNINGSRSEDNVIYIDGAIAVRTRATGAIVGVQNVDAVQEVQVLTANYMPEYGRSSGGQIRFITKGGSSRYTGSASLFYRDDSLQANTWTRNRSTNAIENSGAAPFDYKQYGYAFGGPVPGAKLKDKAFFFLAQEWVNFFQVQTNTATVPTALMRTGNFSELLNPSNGFYTGARIIRNPVTGQPFESNIIPSSMLSANGIALMKLYRIRHPGIGRAPRMRSSTARTRRISGRTTSGWITGINDKNQITYRYSKYNWKAVDAFRGTFPFARTDWDRPNSTQNFNWTSTLTPTLINEFSYSHSLDQVFINVFTETGLHKRSRTGINYPYIFPANKEIEDKIPTINIDTFTGVDGGPYPSSSQGPIHLISNATTWVTRAPHLQRRRGDRVFGRRRLRPDQRQRHSGRHQQPERAVRLP